MNPEQSAPRTHPASPLHLTTFNDLEDELFGAPGTPERAEYETQVARAFGQSATCATKPEVPVRR